MPELRFAQAEDAHRLAEIHVWSWQAAYKDIVPPDFLAALSIEARAERWQAIAGDAQTIVATVDGIVWGFIRVSVSDDPAWGEVQSIYLDPEVYRQGLGTLLLAAGEARLVELGCEYAFLWVFVDNHPARRFYEARGWRADARVALMELGGRQLSETRYSKELR